VDSLSKIRNLRRQVDARLKEIVEGLRGPGILKKAVAHSLLSGGKRLRPLVVIASKELFEAGGPEAMPAACAIELIHTYSLIHDDLPAMDDDSLRRGAPTCHIVFGEAVAILAGDALLTQSFAVVSRAYTDRPKLACRIIREMASAAGCGGMVGGQVLDIMREKPDDFKRFDPENTDLHRVHDMKTGALLRVCFVIGGILGGANKAEIERLASCGGRIGLAFQVIDDCLDATGTDAQLGKNAGSDARKGKETFVDLMGIERARRYAAELEAGAVTDLDAFGKNADLLRTLVKLAVERRS
jgi:geranylgeranyl pyrophosphate synthase